MRAIDANHLKRWIIDRGLKSQLHPADILDQIDRELTIEPEPQWIPCSERLPMMSGYVLTYRPTMGMRMLVDSYEGYYGEDDIEWHEGWVYGGDKVIAWMPLPEPYKEVLKA